MNTKFTVKNFRSFDEEGATFDIAPITLLTGCNSSGKSSLVKSMVLLSKFIQQMKDNYQKNGDCCPQRYPLGVTDVKLQLGNYTSILNRGAEKIGRVSLSYAIKPLQSDKEFVVTYVFAANKTDRFNEGWLAEMTIETTEGDLIFHIVMEDNNVVLKEYNLKPLKNSFYYFSMVRLFERLRSNYYDYDEFGEEHNGMNEEEAQETLNKIKNLANSITANLSQKEYDGYMLWILRNRRNKDIHYQLSDKDCQNIEHVLRYNSLFPLPVFEMLENVSKTDTRQTVMNLNNCKDEDVNDSLAIILDDFEKSQFETLLDYFVAKENNESFSTDPTEKRYFLWSQVDPTWHSNNIFFKIIDSISHYIVNPWWNMDNPKSFTSVRKISLDKTESEIDKFDKDREKQYEEKLANNRKILPFSFVYETLLRHSIYLDEQFASSFPDNAAHFYGEEHPCRKLFRDYIYDLLVSIMLPEGEFDSLRYVTSSRVTIHRLYTFDSNDEFGKLLDNYYKAKRNYKGHYKPDTFLNTWIQRFDIGHHISIKNTDDGLGIVVRLHDTKSDKKGHLLADEGYGISQLMSVLLEIETNILSAKTQDDYANEDGKKKRIDTIVPSTIAIEEPEIHLHPKYQSLLADMFLEAYREHNIHFIVETHSEYLIRKFQTFVGKHSNEPDEGIGEDELSLYYLYSPKDEERPEGEPQVKKIDFNKDGRLTSPFGPGFFDVADDLSYQLLTMKIGG